MLESLYNRSMNQSSDSQAVKVLGLTMFSALGVFAALLVLPINHAIRSEGQVVPENVISVSAAEDAWIKLDKDYTGNTVRSGQTLGTLRYYQNIDNVTHEILLQKERLKLLELEKQQLTYENRTKLLSRNNTEQFNPNTYLPVRLQALDKKMSILSLEIDYKVQRVQPRAFMIEQEGLILSANAKPGEFTWFAKGEEVLSVFDPTQLVVRTQIPSHKAAEIYGVKKVILENRKSKQRFDGRISRVFYRKNQNGNVDMMVDIQLLTAPHVKLGLPLKVSLVTETKPLYALLLDTFS